LAAVKHAEEVAQILKQNVVQGRKVEGEENKYSKWILFEERKRTSITCLLDFKSDD